MRSFILFIATCIALSPLFAQGEFSGGFKAGLNFSNIDGPLENDSESFSVNTGFHIGATVMYSFTDAIGVKGELMYSQKARNIAIKEIRILRFTLLARMRVFLFTLMGKEVWISVFPIPTLIYQF